nr:glycosyltransferase [Syntrophobotulus glycolicus]
MMIPPLLSYVTFNRLGLTISSLSSILNTSDDFEMHIIDNNSTDDTWDYILSLNDSRIKSKTKNPINVGQIHAMNINLARRKEDQYFITIDNDIMINTKDWISRFMQVFDAFPDLGMLGVQTIPDNSPDVTPVSQNGQTYLALNKVPEQQPRKSFIPGSCLCLKPELIEKVGYWSEENCFGDIELSFRVNNFTSFKAGFITDVELSILQNVDCAGCQYKDSCKLNKAGGKTCFSEYKNLNDIFRDKFWWKFKETVTDMQSGARPIYCASLLGYKINSDQIFNFNWATENIQFYINNAN